MRRKWQSTVEPVLGNLLHPYGLRRMGTRGKASAQKTMPLAAIAYSLKKLLKHQPRKYCTVALALPPPSPVPVPVWLRIRRMVANRYARRTFLRTRPEFCNSHEPMTVQISRRLDR